MSESKIKNYRRLIERTVNKDSKEHYREFIFTHMDKLCREPLKIRMQFMWKVLRRINPHTGKKVER